MPLVWNNVKIQCENTIKAQGESEGHVAAKWGWVKGGGG